MNKTDADVMNTNTETVANDLTQLSSREQLSALMDGALPADQTRFLLRRLRHDAPLAECWERWRLTGEVMRGLAPAQRLPADFASRVSAALHDGAPAPAAMARATPAWLRWGGGAAMAASLAVVALMARQPATDAGSAPGLAVAASSAPAIVETASATVPATQSPLDASDATQALAAATAVVASARPQRSRVADPVRAQPALAADDTRDRHIAVVAELPIPQPDIVTRPWPRSVLPQYASGGLAVGFGEHARGATAYNPFQAQAGIGAMSPVSTNAAAGVAGAAEPAADPAPVAPEAQP